MAEPPGAPGPGHRHLVLLALLVLLTCLPGIGARDLWAPDEPRYAEVAREMLQDGSWLVPHLDGQLYDQKPPLFFWLVAWIGWLCGGVDEVAVRLPSVLAALGATLLVYGLGRRLFSRDTGWLSAIVFATASGISWQGRIGQIDMVLTFFVVLAVYCWVRGWLGEPAWHHGFFVATGLATLAKGPVGLVVPLLSVLAFLLWRQDAKTLREMRVGSGLLIWAGIVLVWLAPAVAVAGREYLEYLVLDQSLHRYVAGPQHPRPAWWYLGYLPLDFFPYFFLLPACAGVLRSRLRSDDPTRLRAGFLACWAVTTVAFFSLSPSKRGVYIVAIYAALSLLVGAGAARLIALRGPRAGAVLGLATPAVLLAVALALVPYAADREQRYLEIVEPGLLAGLVTTVSCAAAGMAAAAVLAARHRLRQALHVAAAAMALGGMLLSTWVLPKLDPIKSARPLASTFARLAAPDEPYALYGNPLHAAFVFYAGRYATHVPSRETLERFVRGDGRRWLVIRRDHLDELGGSVPGMVEVVAERDWRRGWVLMTVPPPPRVAARDLDPRALRAYVPTATLPPS